jgi:hypothetical protein
MRRVLLLLLSLLLASGTVAGSIAHAAEDCAQPTPITAAPIMANEMRDWDGCVQVVVKTSQDSPSDDRQSPATVHGCHGHYSGVPAAIAVLPVAVVHAVTHGRAPTAAVPPAAFTGTFRPPIA